MRRIFTTLLTAMLLSAALCVGASASEFDAVAEELSAIGMFRGTAAGFELDRAPTRSEAAIMLVRLYGAEESAKAAYAAGEISHPFTDVSAFTSPYVAWLYTNGITNGYTATTYASQQPCSAQNYVVFLLRALGYRDNVDFAYADALSFAHTRGIYNPAVFEGPFLRDDLAALTYQALAADLADGSTYLLDSLISSGAIDADAAAPMTEKMTLYREMTAATNAEEKSMDMDISMVMGMDLTYLGERESTSVEVSGRVQVNAEDPADIEMSSVTEMDMLGITAITGEWIKDGWVYTETVTGGVTERTKYQLSDELLALQAQEAVDQPYMDVSSLALVESMSKKKDGGNTVYTMVIGDAMAGYLDTVMESMDEADIDTPLADLKFTDIVTTATVGRSGQLKQMVMEYGMAIESDVDGEVMRIAYDYDIVLDVNAVGSKVKVNFPDLSQFEELESSADDYADYFDVPLEIDTDSMTHQQRLAWAVSGGSADSYGLLPDQHLEGNGCIAYSAYFSDAPGEQLLFLRFADGSLAFLPQPDAEASMAPVESMEFQDGCFYYHCVALDENGETAYVYLYEVNLANKTVSMMVL